MCVVNRGLTMLRTEFRNRLLKYEIGVAGSGRLVNVKTSRHPALFICKRNLIPEIKFPRT